MTDMKKCLKCGARNPEERTTCYNCDITLAQGQPAQVQREEARARNRSVSLASILAILLVAAAIRYIAWAPSEHMKAVETAASDRSAIESAFREFQSAVLGSSQQARDLFLSIELDPDVPTVRIRVLPSVWYGCGEYEKRKLASQLFSNWGGYLQQAGADPGRAVVRLYDDTQTCVARSASFGTEVYK